jgi:carbonic anhydrase
MTWKIAIALAMAALATSATAQHHWSYSGEGGPENWGKLESGFAACASGKSQSPIDLGGSTKSGGKPVKLNYKKGATEIENNGHTIEVEYEPGSTLTLDGRTYVLKQFHFHAPSENTFEGKHFPMEGHLVHADKEGHLAVVAVMFREGAANSVLATLWKSMPGKAGDKKPLSSPVSALGLLPAERSYYRFAGSLTTPPCSEGVQWLVIKHPVTASKDQIGAFTKAIGGGTNNRPVQPLNGRKVAG